MELMSVRVDTIDGSTSPQRSLEATSPQRSLQASPSSSSSSSPDPPPLEGSSVAGRVLTRAQTWKSLKESVPHSRYLTNLEREEKVLLNEVSSHKKAVQRLSKDLYQVVSIYALLQGVLFASTAQSSVFTCADWWGPVFIAVAVTVGTFFGVLDKLRSIGEKEEEVKRFKLRHNAVFDIIDKLRGQGAYFDLDINMGPQHNQLQDRTPGCHCVFSLYGLLVLGFLLGFSALIIISCLQMMCSNCKCS